jgi:hypothetical protein
VLSASSLVLQGVAVLVGKRRAAGPGVPCDARRGALEWLAGEHRQHEKERRTRLREKLSREKDRRNRKG